MGGTLRRFRAIAVLVVIVGSLFSAIPRAKMSPEEWADPDLWRPELEQWSERLAFTGVTEDQVRATAIPAAKGWALFVKGLVFPFRPFFDATRTNQSWGLFAVVSEKPERLVIEVRRDGEWELLYRRLDPVASWHDDQMKYRRVRGIWDSVKAPPKGNYKRLTRWLARTIFLEQPDVDAVRVKLEKHYPTVPWDDEVKAPTFRAERMVTRRKLMGEEPDDEVIPADGPEDEEPL